MPMDIWDANNMRIFIGFCGAYGKVRQCCTYVMLYSPYLSMVDAYVSGLHHFESATEGANSMLFPGTCWTVSFFLIIA